MSKRADFLEKLEWDPLFIASKEVLKMIREDFISDEQGNKELLKLSKDLKTGVNSTLPLVDRYKLNLINEAHVSIGERIFTMQDIENLKKYYNRPDMTIFGTPRKLTPETEMAWAIINPLIDRLEKWKKIRELSLAGVISETDLAQGRDCVISGQAFSTSLEKSILFLDRMKYAKHKGIVDADGYVKAVKLIPLMRKELLGEVPDAAVNMNSEEIVEGIEQGDKQAFEQQIAVEENVEVSGFVEKSDPLMEWRRLVYILIDAWQATLGYDLRDEFQDIASTIDLEVLQDAHKFLVHLNKEFLSDEQEVNMKKSKYLQKIREFSAKNTVKSAIV